MIQCTRLTIDYLPQPPTARGCGIHRPVVSRVRPNPAHVGACVLVRNARGHLYVRDLRFEAIVKVDATKVHACLRSGTSGHLNILYVQFQSRNQLSA